MATPHRGGANRCRPEFQSVTPHTIGRLRVLRIADVELEIDAHNLRVAGTPIHLPHREFQVLLMLMDNAGRVVTRRELLDNLWGPQHPDVHKTIEVHINRLRRRLEHASNHHHIRTVRGLGYVFDLPDPPA